MARAPSLKPDIHTGIAAHEVRLHVFRLNLAQLALTNNGQHLRVKKTMLSNPPGVLSEGEVAARLFISKRTMARRLKAEGTRFRALRDQMLAQQPARYLDNSNLPVEAITRLMNYHDSANFRRAFKRWFGVTPNNYRSQRLCGECWSAPVTLT
ncbi:helix-turn-helix transcriptional regulator [Marinobacter sp. VGCF2001]|uniref:helix-turn-helix transcriptional regulator n=1 Tax=Marinobacter sp. VGCF2001 TaxID=3417189 RepID=UPI003CF4ABCE